MHARLALIVLGFLVVGVGFAASCVIWRAAEVGELVQPLTKRGFPRLAVISVGTGSAYENPERRGPSTAIGWGNHLLLVDAGSGVTEGLRRAQIPVDQPARVLLTNLLPVNTQGLDELIFTGWLQGRKEPLLLIGPRGTRAFAEALMTAYREGSGALGGALELPPRGRGLEVIEADDDFTADWDELRAIARELPGGPTPALAWRFEGGGRTVVVSGTGWGRDALVDFARGADVLVHEAVAIPKTDELEDAGVVADPRRLEAEASIHTSLFELGALARDAEVRTLVVTRMRPPPFYPLQVRMIVGEEYDGEIRVPEDGDEFEP